MQEATAAPIHQGAKGAEGPVAVAIEAPKTGAAKGGTQANAVMDILSPCLLTMATVEMSRLSSWVSTREGAPRAPGSPGRLLPCGWQGHRSALLLARW
jgi:hypothetical protein